MKTVYLHRHGKAVKEFTGSDFARDLKPSGLADADRLGRYLRQRGFLADLLLTSPANRALQTAQLLAGQTHESVLTDPRLYGADAGTLLDILRGQPDTADTVRLVGHNPGLEDLGALLCGLRPGGIHLVTCGVLCIRIDTDRWASLAAGQGTLEWLIGPGQI